jgi:hypothetical protein
MTCFLPLFFWGLSAVPFGYAAAAVWLCSSCGSSQLHYRFMLDLGFIN